MDSSKAVEECSSSESGWTTYIASPDRVTEDHDDNDDDDDDGSGGVTNGYKKDRAEEELDSDDSMASDASSGPSDLYGHFVVGAGNRDARKYVVGKKCSEKEEKKKQIKRGSEKDKSGNRVNSAGKSKKNV